MHAKFPIGSDNKGKRKQIPASDPISKFWSNVKKTDTCWIWTGLKRKGYGQFRLNKRLEQAHRVSYTLAFPKHSIGGLVIMHKCDNPSCVNPSHLMAGSQKDNMLDMHKKGRAHIQSQIGSAGQKAAIDAYMAGFKRLHIANYFKVHPTTITRLLKRNGIAEEWKQKCPQRNQK